MYYQTWCSRRRPSCKAAWPRWSWNIHVSRVCTNLLRVVFLRQKLRHGITKKYLVTVYHSLLYHTVLLYGQSAACKSVLLLQKKALWTTVSVDHFEHFWPIFQCLRILTVYGQYVFNSLLHIKENWSAYDKRQDTYNAWGAGDSTIPHCRLTKLQKCFPVSTALVFTYFLT